MTIVVTLVVFLAGVLAFSTVMSLWLCGAMFLCQDYNKFVGVCGFILPPIGLFYGIAMIVKDKQNYL